MLAIAEKYQEVFDHGKNVYASSQDSSNRPTAGSARPHIRYNRIILDPLNSKEYLTQNESKILPVYAEYRSLVKTAAILRKNVRAIAFAFDALRKRFGCRSAQALLKNEHIIQFLKNQHKQKEKPLILLAEDEPLLQRINRDTLEDLGYQVVVANNGMEAIQFFQSNPACKLILMDVNMPVMNGIEATLKIRKQGITLPIVAYTSDDSDMIKHACLTAGMNAVAIKPMQKEKLEKFLKRFF